MVTRYRQRTRVLGNPTVPNNKAPYPTIQQYQMTRRHIPQSNSTKRHGAISHNPTVPNKAPYPTIQQYQTTRRHIPQSNSTKRHGAISHNPTVSNDTAPYPYDFNLYRGRNNFQARDSIHFCILPSALQFIPTTVDARRHKDSPKRHTCAEQQQSTLQPSAVLSTPFKNRVSFFHPFLLINSS